MDSHAIDPHRSSTRSAGLVLVGAIGLGGVIWVLSPARSPRPTAPSVVANAHVAVPDATDRRGSTSPADLASVDSRPAPIDPSDVLDLAADRPDVAQLVGLAALSTPSGRSTSTGANVGSSLTSPQLVRPAALFAPTDLRKELPPAVAAWLDQWEHDVRSGNAGATSTEELVELEALLGSPESHLSALEVVRLGDLLSDALAPGLSRDAALAVIDRLAVTAAERELDGLNTDHDRNIARPVLNTVRDLRLRIQTRPDWPLAERLFGLLIRWSWTEPRTRDAFWNHYVHAEAILNQGRAEDAAEGFKRLETIISDIAVGEEDRVDLKWGRGLSLFRAGRYNEAIPYLQNIADRHDHNDAPDAAVFLVIAEARIGSIAQAESHYRGLLGLITRSTNQGTVIEELDHAVAIKEGK